MEQETTRSGFTEGDLKSEFTDEELRLMAQFEPFLELKLRLRCGKCRRILRGDLQLHPNAPFVCGSTPGGSIPRPSRRTPWGDYLPPRGSYRPRTHIGHIAAGTEPGRNDARFLCPCGADWQWRRRTLVRAFLSAARAERTEIVAGVDLR
jgi:hypothetical protein